MWQREGPIVGAGGRVIGDGSAEGQDLRSLTHLEEKSSMEGSRAGE